MKSVKYIFICLITAALMVPSLFAEHKIKVVTTFSDYATITKAIGGDYVDVDYLSSGDQDPHFIPPKPSLAMKLKKADMLVSTGLDLEMWLTSLQDKARNKKIMEGAEGFVTAAEGLDLLQKPKIALSRTEGDIHIYGNPHIHTSPVNWITISENIMIGLQKLDPAHSDFYAENQKAFVDKIYRAMFGDELVDLIGGKELVNLLEANTLFDFLDSEYEGSKLIDKLGGWMKKALPLRGLQVVAYHKNWAYFARDFGIVVRGYIEVKPGIPPTPKQVEQVINLIEKNKIKIMMVASYFEKRKPSTIAKRTGIKAVFLPFSVGGNQQVTDNFKLIDFWIDALLDAYNKN